MPEKVVDRNAAATLAYENAGREISQAFDTLNSNLTLAAGTLGALLTVLGAGQLLAPQGIVVQVAGKAVKQAGSAPVPTIAGIPRLSDVSLLLLAAAFPLLVRFFIRATIGYQQLLRFNLIQKSAWAYLSGEADWRLPQATIRIYSELWRSPAPRWSLFRGSFKYGFAWVFAISVIAITWGFVTAPGLVPRLVAGGFLVVAMVWEVLTLRKLRDLDAATEEQRRELKQLRSSTGPPAATPQTRSLGLIQLLILGWYVGRRSHPQP